MSSDTLCKLAYDIGYRPSDRKLTPSSLEWMFLQNEASKSFMHWFCSNISAKNVISDAEIKEFASLQKDGAVLSGNDLEEALRDFSPFNAHVEEDSLEKEIAQLEAELNPLKKHAQLLARRQTTLETHAKDARKKNAVLSSVLKSRRDSFSKSLYPRLSHRVNQLDHVSLNLKSYTHQLMEFFASALSNAGSTNHSAPFLSTSSWKEYHHFEEQYAKQVRMYMRRLIANPETSTSSSIGTSAAHTPSVSLGDQHLNSAHGDQSTSENSRFFWLRLADPKLVRFRGVHSETHARQSTELARLRELFIPSESEKTRAQLELARRTAEMETFKLQIIASHQQSLPLDDSTFKQKYRELSRKQQRLKALLATNVEILLPELYQELARLQSTPILWADYNLKLSRLHLQRVKIDLVVSSLLKQRAKSLVLSRVLNDEKRQHILLHRLVDAVLNESKHLAHTWNERTETLLFRAVHPPVPPQLHQFQLISQLINAGLTFAPHRFANATAEAGNSKRTIDAQILLSRELDDASKLSVRLQLLYSLLFKHSSGKQPLLTSSHLVELCRSMDASTVALATSMESLLREFNSKAKSIADLPRELQFERNLWILFFGRSTQLQRSVQELQSKVYTKKAIK